jgi:hypothetical protein
MQESALQSFLCMAGSEPKSDAARACGPTETDPFDDMHDNQADWDQYASVLPLRWLCEIGEAFDRSDGEAKKFQRWHRWFTYAAALLATLTVVLAIVGLGFVASDPPEASKLRWEDRFDLGELTAASLTLVIVFVGFGLRFKEKWLRLRHRAELYRLLRYNFLIQPSLWSGGQDPQAWIAKEIAGIDKRTGGKLEEAINEPSPSGPYEAVESRMPRHRLQALTQYYLSKRLGPQKEYLANRAQRNEVKDRMRVMLPFFFFGSIVAVAAKLAMKSFHHSWWAFGFVLAATMLPVFAAGLRTYLAAFEFSRNKSRFSAAHKALSETEKSLVQNTFEAVSAEPNRPGHQESLLWGSPLGQVIVVAEQSAMDAAAAHEDEASVYPVLRDLAWCEHVLDAEHREWFRLMYDAEWFG